jgi:hypothetical protein
MIKLGYNFAASEAGWFACVLGAANGLPWVGPLAVLVLASVHLRLAERPGGEIRIMLAAILIGLVADSLLVITGLVSYPNGTWIEGLAPYWILAMWAMFATTLNLSMRWMQRRLLLASLLGAIFGPLAYLAGEELGAINFESRILAISALAVIWAVSMPLLVSVATRWGGSPRPYLPEYIHDDWRVKSSA